ncbi:MAG: Adaptive-response sensory-kinase SasA [Anaerolineales bacterium]|nr:Adaptive-response sensory-kinase SasA [Anaerolineales bacterium]
MPTDRYEFLKDASQITGAGWAALVERESGHWQVRAGHQLTRHRKEALGGFLANVSVDAWLCGALSGGHARSRAQSAPGMEETRLFAYPVHGSFFVILVGAQEMDERLQNVWRMAAAFLAERQESADVTFLQSELLLPDLESDSPYNVTRALGRALRAYVNVTKAQGGWLAIRRGETLDVQAQWNSPASVGLALSMEESGVWRRVGRSLKPLALKPGDADWERLPREALRGTTKAWACFPLVIGQRLIGVVALWRQSPFDSENISSLEELTAQVAPVVEIIITIASMADHMRRLAILNDFALTVSSAQSLDQIARRVFDLLARAFNTERIALHLLSVDGRLLREYYNREGRITSLNAEVSGHPFQTFLKSGKTLRVPDAGAAGYLPVFPDSVSALTMPLRYRGRSIGMVTLESARMDDFSIYDDHLLGVIASHLAALVEYSRLREDAEGRARNLGLIHEVVSQVVGMTDKREIAQITADLLNQYFAYDLTAVLLADNEHRLTIRGFGGKIASTVERTVAKNDSILSEGISGHVFRTGKSLLVNDVDANQMYRSVPGWQSGSEMCVALRDGDQVIGVVNVERKNKSAFTQNDLLDLESLAGILASVVSSADAYQRLQDSIRQLRSTQDELQRRIEAQRQAESRLVQAAKLAAVGEMAAGIAHELNNPLTTVTGFVELTLKDLPADAASRSDLELVLREATRARDVVRRLLDFSRQTESSRARLDLTEVLEDVLALTHHLIHTSGVDLVKDFGALPWISIDRNQMKQVFLNLIHNSLQAMPSGGELYLQSCVERRDAREWVKVTVRDTGEGISAEHKKRLFEPFFTTKSERGGTGLGLSVSYGIVTDHGGVIDVESESGRGAAFIVWLPI